MQKMSSQYILLSQSDWVLSSFENYSTLLECIESIRRLYLTATGTVQLKIIRVIKFLTVYITPEELYPHADHARVLADGDDPHRGRPHPLHQDLHLAVGVSVGPDLLGHGPPAGLLRDVPDLDGDGLGELLPLSPGVPALGDHTRHHHLPAQLHLNTGTVLQLVTP